MFLQLLIIQIVALFLLFLFLRQLFQKQLDGALGRLKVLHERNLARETELGEMAVKARLEQEDAFRRANEEAERIIQEAREQAARLISEMTASMKEKFAQEAARKSEEFAKKERQLMTAHRIMAADFGLQMTRMVFSSRAMRALHEEMIDELFSEIVVMPADSLVSVMTEISVVTAYPLEDFRVSDLTAVLEGKMGRPPILKFEQDSALICGMVVRASTLLMDGSLRGRLEKAAELMKK